MKALGYSSVAKCLPGKHEFMCSIPGIKNKAGIGDVAQRHSACWKTQCFEFNFCFKNKNKIKNKTESLRASKS